MVLTRAFRAIRHPLGLLVTGSAIVKCRPLARCIRTPVPQGQPADEIAIKVELPLTEVLSDPADLEECDGARTSAVDVEAAPLVELGR